MGLFSFLNPITAPLGFKLGSGGPYPDAGKGDQMQANVSQYLAQIAPLIAQIAQNAGVQNPMGPQGQVQEGAGANPYALSPLQQGQVNQQASIDTGAYDTILSKVKANLAARGMADSSTMTAAEAYLRKQLAAQTSANQLQAGENAFQNRNQALMQISQLLGTGFGAQQQVTDTQRQIAQQSNAQAMDQLGNLLALGMYAGGVGPFGKSKPLPTTGGVAGPLPQGQAPGGFGSGFGGGGGFNLNNWGSQSVYR